MAYGTDRPRPALARVLATQTGELAAEIPRARRGRVKAVHRARTVSRRLRELLPVAATAAPGRAATRARRDVRRITRALGRLRELDVALALLDKMTERERWSETVISPLRRELQATRERRAATLARALDAALTDRVQARCDAVVEALDATRSRRWERALASRLRRRARRLTQTIASAGTLYAPEALHQVRIATKKLRYALELAHTAAGSRVGRMLGILKQAQDGLGHWHDLQVLERLVRAVEAAEVDRTRADDYVRVAAALERECRAEHAAFLGERAALTRVAERVLRQIVPALSQPAVVLTPRSAAIPPAQTRRRAAAK
jgi:CHAD domain-containing protein